MAEPRLLIVGGANVQLSLNVSRFPSAGETLISDGAFSFVPGGRGGDAAVLAAHLGTDTLLCTRLGNDRNGLWLKDYYEKAGVDTRFIRLDRNRPTALSQTITQADKTTRTLLFSGALPALSDEDVEDAFSAYPDGLLVHFEGDEFLFKRACELAAELSIPVFADAMHPTFEYPRSMPRLEAMVLGEAETYAYTDIYPDCLDNYVRACIRLNAKINSHYFLIRLKGRGTFITDGKYSEIIPLPEVPGEAVEGPDGFTAAVAAEVLSGQKMGEAVKTASVVSAYLSMNSMAADPFPTREKLQEFCEKYNIR